MNWITIITIIGSCFALISILVTMFIFLATKIDSLTADISMFRREMTQEIEDFHGRLCSIEERNKNK